MRKIIILLLGVILLLSCKKYTTHLKENVCVVESKIYKNKFGTELNLGRQKWYLKKNSLGGVDVGILIKGSIKGDSVLIRTYGDGLISDCKIDLNSQNEFNQDFNLYFTSAPFSQKYITATTSLLIFNRKDTLKVNINSKPLRNIQY